MRCFIFFKGILDNDREAEVQTKTNKETKTLCGQELGSQLRH